jgi:putative flippase GtrA
MRAGLHRCNGCAPAECDAVAGEGSQKRLIDDVPRGLAVFRHMPRPHPVEVNLLVRLRVVGYYSRIVAADESWRSALLRMVAQLREEGIVGQGARFVITGVVVSIIYISVTTLLAEVVGLRFEIALVIGWCSAITVHFTMQRLFVWASHKGFALPFAHQIARYLLLACSQLGITTATTALLPGVLGLPTEAIYLATAALLTLLNFIVFRQGVFHPNVADAVDHPRSEIVAAELQ